MLKYIKSMTPVEGIFIGVTAISYLVIASMMSLLISPLLSFVLVAPIVQLALNSYFIKYGMYSKNTLIRSFVSSLLYYGKLNLTKYLK